MTNATRLLRTSLAAVAAVACTMAGSHPASAATDVADTSACRSQQSDARVLHRTSVASTSATKMVVARVALSRDGLVRRIAIHPTGDPAFDAAAFRAIELTAFAPAARSCAAIDSDFEYVLVARPGRFASAVLPTQGDFLASH